MRAAFLYLIVLALGAACSESPEPEVEKSLKSNTERHREMVKTIDSLELLVYSDEADMKSPATGDLLQNYLKFAKMFPGDKERSPQYLYKAAAVSRANKLGVKAVKLYSEILQKYPNYIKAPEVAFLLAFTYDEDLKQKDEAKKAYRDVIEKYPGDKWAKQAEERLKNIDMSDEELIEKF
ncbi:MAG TPA: tetratricopeptide repeat protein, partial [Cryomorphaceae bacterium]|nr:tetratricopeptide repeat protein [Cryomorphaceae bacterium]